MKDEAPFAANRERAPALCPDFLIETYLDYQVSSLIFLPDYVDFFIYRNKCFITNIKNDCVIA